jgi:hypothetical protein
MGEECCTFEGEEMCVWSFGWQKRREDTALKVKILQKIVFKREKCGLD